MKKFVIAAFSFAAFITFFAYAPFNDKPQPQNSQILATPQKPVPSQYDIPNPIPGYQTYQEIVSCIQDWNKRAPEITEVGTYGKTSQGRDIYYLRLSGKKAENNPKVLLTACIHGNEKIANATLMGILGNMLKDYGRDEKVTNLINTRDIYWVPVVSPDSYIADSRYVDNVDPNRNFPYPGNPNIVSVAPIAALRDFFVKNKFQAALSGHAYSSVYIYPYGYTKTPAPDRDAFASLTGRMAQLSGYQAYPINELQTAPPYHGFEADWFYDNGAFGIVCEFGREFKPPASMIQPEVNKTYKAFQLFIEEAPLVKLKKK